MWLWNTPCVSFGSLGLGKGFNSIIWTFYTCRDIPCKSGKFCRQKYFDAGCIDENKSIELFSAFICMHNKINVSLMMPVTKISCIEILKEGGHVKKIFFLNFL